MDIVVSTAYFPPISYFIFFAKSGKVFIEQMETFPKQTYRNRCEILTAAGKIKLVVPVSKPMGNHTLTKEIIISYRENWPLHQWKSIQAAYRSSPYFNYYEDVIRPLFEMNEHRLVDHNHKILNVLLKILGLNPEIEFTSDYFHQPEGLTDLRHTISGKKKSPGNDLLPYPQVFNHKTGFIPDLSILDLLFNLGNEAKAYLEKCDYPLH